MNNPITFKRLATHASLLLMPLSLWAMPLSFNYQGKVSDSNAAALPRTEPIWFKLYHKTTPNDPGTLVYAEQAGVTISADGIINHAVGTGTPVAAQTLEAGDFSAPAGQSVYLSIAIGSEGNVLSPATPVHAVPMAVVAKSIDGSSLTLTSLTAGIITANAVQSPEIRSASTYGDAIAGQTSKVNYAGIVGIGTNGAVGVYARSDTGRAGSFDGPLYATSISSPQIRGDSTNGDAIGGHSSAPNHAGVVGIGTNGAVGIYARSDSGRAGSFDGPVFVSEQLSAKIVEVRGADLAEGFDQADGAAAAPGTVMVIDEVNPGKVKASASAYDRKVAGIISGAGGVRAGLKLAQEGVADGNNDIAMAGRVYANASAENGPIAAGDLLTTSNTPGHAMKATDTEISHGAIIGKAMTELREGTGMVLVLVNLQ